MKRFAWLLLTLLPLLPTRVHAGAWSPAPGHGYAKLWLKWLPGFGYHAGNGKTYDYGHYHEVFLNAYGELGLAPRLAATLHFPLAQFFSLEDTPSGEQKRHFTVGDPALGLRYQVLSLGRFAAALEGYARAPLSPAGIQQPFYDKDKVRIGGLRIGTGVWDYYAGGALGYGWDRVYVSGTGGYITRTGGYRDVINWTAEVGGRYTAKWQGRLRVTGWHSLQRGSAPLGEGPSGIGNGTRYLGTSIETEYFVRPRWVLGFALQGGAGLLSRQTGGPVIDLYVATAW